MFQRLTPTSTSSGAGRPSTGEGQGRGRVGAGPTSPPTPRSPPKCPGELRMEPQTHLWQVGVSWNWAFLTSPYKFNLLTSPPEIDLDLFCIWLLAWPEVDLTVGLLNLTSFWPPLPKWTFILTPPEIDRSFDVIHKINLSSPLQKLISFSSSLLQKLTLLSSSPLQKLTWLLSSPLQKLISLTPPCKIDLCLSLPFKTLLFLPSFQNVTFYDLVEKLTPLLPLVKSTSFWPVPPKLTNLLTPFLNLTALLASLY